VQFAEDSFKSLITSCQFGPAQTKLSHEEGVVFSSLLNVIDCMTTLVVFGVFWEELHVLQSNAYGIATFCFLNVAESLGVLEGKVVAVNV
jgi:hypothetical protein